MQRTECPKSGMLPWTTMLHLFSIILEFRDILICEYYVALVRYFLFEFCNSHAIASYWFGSCESKRQKDGKQLDSVSLWLVSYYWKIIKSFIFQPRRNLTQSCTQSIGITYSVMFHENNHFRTCRTCKALKVFDVFLFELSPLMHWYFCISFSFVLWSLILSCCISVIFH